MSTIKVSNLSKDYEDKKILKNINMEIEGNKLIAIVGKSGSGKTSLLNIIGGLDFEYEGEIIVDGKKVLKRNQNRYLRDKVSFILQSFGLILDETIGYNLDIGLKYRSDLSKEEKKELKNKVMKLLGLEFDLETKIIKLSGGEQQRIAIARAIIKKSEIILADEPTGSLDEETAKDILKILKGLKSSVLIVTHDNDIANFCDHIYMLKDNGIIKVK